MQPTSSRDAILAFDRDSDVHMCDHSSTHWQECASTLQLNLSLKPIPGRHSLPSPESYLQPPHRHSRSRPRIRHHPPVVQNGLLRQHWKPHRSSAAKPSSEFATLTGVSEVLLQGLLELSGSTGAIAALPNILPKLHVQLYQLYWDD